MYGFNAAQEKLLQQQAFGNPPLEILCSPSFGALK
jgi:hypothetical protein